MRIRVEIREVPAEHAARRMGLSLADFQQALAGLVARGFPEADPDTGNFDLDAIDAWRKARHPHLFGGATLGPRDASTVVDDRFAAARGRSNHG